MAKLVSYPNQPKPQPQTFRAVLRLEGKTATGIEVPRQVVEAFGAGQKPPVRVTLGGHTYRSTVAAYQGVYMIPVAAEHREAAGLKAGDEVAVTLELDTEPRMVELPPDFSEALAADADAQHSYDSLSYSHKRRWLLSVEGAKTPETRQRRIAAAIKALHAGKKP